MGATYLSHSFSLFCIGTLLHKFRNACNCLTSLQKLKYLGEKNYREILKNAM